MAVTIFAHNGVNLSPPANSFAEAETRSRVELKGEKGPLDRMSEAWAKDLHERLRGTLLYHLLTHDCVEKPGN